MTEDYVWTVDDREQTANDSALDHVSHWFMWNSIGFTLGWIIMKLVKTL